MLAKGSTSSLLQVQSQKLGFYFCWFILSDYGSLTNIHGAFWHYELWLSRHMELGSYMFSGFFLVHMQWFIFCVHEPLLKRRHSQTPQMCNIRQNVSTGQEGNAAEIRIEYLLFFFYKLKMSDRQVQETCLANTIVSDNFFRKIFRIFCFLVWEGGGGGVCGLRRFWDRE